MTRSVARSPQQELHEFLTTAIRDHPGHQNMQKENRSRRCMGYFWPGYLLIYSFSEATSLSAVTLSFIAREVRSIRWM